MGFHQFVKYQRSTNYDTNMTQRENDTNSRTKNLKKDNFDRLICQICDKLRHVASSCYQLRDVFWGKFQK